MEYELSLGATRSESAPVVVLLHGRGSDKDDLQGLRPLLPADWTLLTPRAPHPGGPWGYGAGWAWYRYIRDDSVEAATLSDSLKELDALIARLPEILGFAPGPLVLGGFSQGGTTSMAYALNRPGKVAAVLNFSGFLEAELDLSGAASAPPIFWGHGLADPAIPHRLAVRGRQRLTEAGAAVTTWDHGIGHWIVAEEVESAVQMTREAIG